MKTMLSNREFEVFLLICGGISNKAAADKTCTTEKTIKFHLTNIYRKLQCKSRTEMTARYYQKTLPFELLQRIAILEGKTGKPAVVGPVLPPAPPEAVEIEAAPDTGLPRGLTL